MKCEICKKSEKLIKTNLAKICDKCFLLFLVEKKFISQKEYKKELNELKMRGLEKWKHKKQNM